ncbi:hypothetical protein DDW11_05670 [Sulfolobus sp. SCGC AB-777_G06]|nr:hypothetical protein DDW11_05675 [Sulfolobus sp. SCGC AB-777_G06]PVU74630.1 hypothetical protein DDW11_05670 [Sulfolobus sp. SCGC AB-777_G06]
MAISLSEEIEMNDEEYGIAWFYDKKNVIDSMPNLIGFTENKVKLRIKRFLFLEKTLEYKLTSTLGEGYIEYKFETEDSSFALLVTLNKNKKRILLSLIYSGKYENQMTKLLKGLVINLKMKYLEQKQKMVSTTGETISSKLASLSYIAKLVSTSMLVYSDKLDLSKKDISLFIEETLRKFSHYPVIYILGFNDETVFRLLFVKGELKGVYIRISGKEFYSEEALSKLKGLFNVSVYSSLLRPDMVI